MQNIRQEFSKHKIPSDIIDVLLCSWRVGTQKQYNVYLHKWNEFCLPRKVDSMHPSVNDVLEFFHELFKKGLAYSTLNTARAALGNYLMGAPLSGTCYTVSNHPFIVRYFKGVFNCRKPSPRYSETWDVDVVLNYMKLLYPLEKISLKELTLKLVGLLALTSGQRCQTLVHLDIEGMKKTPNYYLFHLKGD